MAAVTQEEKLDHQLDAERAVLGSVLIDEGIAKDVVAQVDAQDFLNPTNRMIFQAIRKLFRSGEPVDSITIRDRIGAQYTDFLVQLMEVTPTSANWRSYARIMHEQATLGRIRDLADKMLVAATLEDCRPLAADLGQLLAEGRQLSTWNTREMLEDFFAAQEDQGGVEYIATGIREVDEGSYIERGDVIVIGGLPSSGKTALAVMMAHRMARKYKVGFFSLETDKRKIRDRALAHVMQIDFGAIKQRALDENDWAAVAAKQADFAGRNLTVLEASGLTATEIQAITQAYGFEVIFIDYVQLITPEIDRRASRSDQMADVSRSLHTFAQKSKTLVVELAQLSRPDKSGGWREPEMQDLKESGQFEQDADLIFMLYKAHPKDELYGGENRDKYRILKIAKNKEGRTGKWPMYFDGSRQTFATIVPGEVKKDSHEIIRDLVDAGKAAKAKNRNRPLPGQQTMVKITELKGDAAKDVPF